MTFILKNEEPIDYQIDRFIVKESSKSSLQHCELPSNQTVILPGNNHESELTIPCSYSNTEPFQKYNYYINAKFEPVGPSSEDFFTIIIPEAQIRSVVTDTIEK